MKLRRASVRPPPETIIALIDVVFFLLVFFMLIGRMDATAPFDVSPPIALTGADMPGGGVTISVSADGALALDAVPISGAELALATAQLGREAPDTAIRINAHHSAELRHVLPLITRLEDGGLTDIGLVVTPEAP